MTTKTSQVEQYGSLKVAAKDSIRKVRRQARGQTCLQTTHLKEGLYSEHTPNTQKQAFVPLVSSEKSKEGE